MITDHQRIGIALELLSEGVLPFFEREMRAVYGESWEHSARAQLRSQANAPNGVFQWDAQAILTSMWDHWNFVFRRKLGMVERSIISELREFRNRWAHQSSVSEDDCYRVLDSVQRLLWACDASEYSHRIEEHKFEVLRRKLGRRVNEELARARFNRSRVVDSALFALCGVSIAVVALFVWGRHHPQTAGFIAGFTIFAFAYLIYKRFQVTPPAYGIHECPNCGKVIYNEVCPYCEPLIRVREPIIHSPEFEHVEVTSRS